MSNIKNLIAIDGNERFIWNAELGHLEVTENENKQILLLTSRPYFTVKEIRLSPVKNYLALTGDNGVTIVELPKKWGRRYKAEKDSQIYCKTFNLNERQFMCEKRIRLNHVDWHPYGLETRQVLCILTNDNRLRLYDVTANTELQSINIRTRAAIDDEEDEDDLCLGMSMINLGEFAIRFDFGPPMVIQEPDILWPIYILMGTGDVNLIYTNFHNPTYAEHVIGPLTMLPQAEDNYGADACSLIVLDSSPPLIVIATTGGVIYHCFAIADNKTLLSNQTLYVYEAIELSKDLIENPDDPYSPHPIQLYKDPTSEIRYFCVHENGVHAVVVPFIEAIQSGMIEEKEAFSEFIICTRTSTPSDANESIEQLSTPRGLGVEVRQSSIVLLVLMANNEPIVQRISPATAIINRKRFPRHNLNMSRESADQEILNISQVDASRSNFEEQIQQILKRKSSVPLLKLTENLEQQDQIGELIDLAAKTFRQEYLKRFELAAEAIEKKLKILEKDMQSQKVEYNKIAKEKDEVYISVIALSSKAEMAVKKQKELLARIDSVLATYVYGHPDLSEVEAKLRRDLTTTNDKLRFYRDELDSIINKHKYHLNRKDPVHNAQSDLILSPTQLNGIKESLAKQGADIADLKRFVKSKQKTKET